MQVAQRKLVFSREERRSIPNFTSSNAQAIPKKGKHLMSLTQSNFHSISVIKVPNFSDLIFQPSDTGTLRIPRQYPQNRVTPELKIRKSKAMGIKKVVKDLSEFEKSIDKILKL